MMKGVSCVLLAAGAVLAGGLSGGTVRIDLDFGRRVAKMKPMHAVGQGPIQGWNDFSMFAYLKEAHVPFMRFHDVGGAFGGNRFVDVPNIFRDFDADENDPKNYDFLFTDQLVKACLANGIEPFFRLGVTIENRSALRKYRIHPPKDFAKWARVCERIVAHYNKGWADGFTCGIRYWEIWNEPDDRGDPQASFMWCGSFADYCRLYDVTAKLLKAKHPEIRVGGYASCGYGAARPHEPLSVPKGWKPNPTGHDGVYFIRCTLDFLDYVRDHGAPLDFFSFHSYDSPKRLLEEVECVSLEMRRRGISPELILNEWLPEPSHLRVFSPEQNADIARTLVGGQHSDLAMLMLYDARIAAARSPYAPLFNPLTAKPEGAFYALKYFGELYRRGWETASSLSGDAADVSVCAASDGKRDGAVMVVNASDREVALDFGAAASRFRHGSSTEYNVFGNVRLGLALFDLPKTLAAKSYMLLVFDLP